MALQKVRLKELAKALSLSESTISKALKDSHEISTATKKRVHNYAREVNFRLNSNASNLRSLRSYLIGVVVPDLTNEFLSQAISGINSVSEQNGVYTIVSETNNSAVKETKLIDGLVGRSVDGLIISASSGNLSNSYLKQLHERGMPIVFFNNVLTDISTFKVISNNYECMFNTVSSLIRSGYKHIAYLSCAELLSADYERLEGYKSALSEHGVPLDSEMILLYSHDTKALEFENQIVSLLTAGRIPDVLFISMDVISPIVLKVLAKLNLTGYKIKLVCVSNSNVANLSERSVSFIKQPAYEMGQIAAQLLMKLINEGRPEKCNTVILKSQLNWKV